MKKTFFFVTAALIVFVAVNEAHSQLQLFPRGTRNIAMGGTGVADLASPVNGYYNPAALALTNGVFLESNFHEYLDWSSYTDTRVTAGSSRGDFFFGGMLGFTTEYYWQDCMYTSCSYECEPLDKPDYYISGGVAAAKRMGIFSAGLGAVVKRMKQKGPTGYSSMSIDIGAIVEWAVETENKGRISSTIGTSLRNISGDIEIESECGKWKIEQMGESRQGLGLNFSTPPADGVTKKLGREVPALTVSVLYDLVRGFGSMRDTDGWGVGMEASLFETLYLRAGKRDGDYLFSMAEFTTLGLGLAWQHPTRGFAVRLDYAMMEPPANVEKFWGKDMTDHMIGLVLGKVF